MKAQYAILRFAKYKGPEIGHIESHNERTKEKYASNPDVDTSRSHLNFHLVTPQRKYRAEAEKQIAEAGCRTRSDSVRVVGAARPDPFTARPGPDVCFEIVGDRLETDADGVLLTYVSGLVTTFPELFADMLAWRVAFEMAPYISQGGAQAEGYLQMFEQALDRAKVEDDAQAAPPAVPWPSLFLGERRVG